MVRSDRATSLQEVLGLPPALAERSRDWQPLTEPVTTAPLIYRTPEPVRDNLIFVGDAAAFIDPFVGDGISIALRTGQLAANGLRPALKNPVVLRTAVANYQKKYEEQFVPLITAASRIRPLLSWPKPAQFAVLEVLRLPGLMPYLIRSTRKAR
jgi:flavin-dependent dehydrogenase